MATNRRFPDGSVHRERYSLEDAMTDGESVLIQFHRDDCYFDVRMTPEVANQLSRDLKRCAKASRTIRASFRKQEQKKAKS